MKRALVIGAPVAQARSPLLHSFWLKNMASRGRIGREEVQPSMSRNSCVISPRVASPAAM